MTTDVGHRTLADAFTEWERRWREDPEAYESDVERLAGTEAEYGDGAATYFESLLAEHEAGRHCSCGSFVSDPSGDAGCGNCGADEPPLEHDPSDQ